MPAPTAAQSCFALQTELMSLQARGAGGGSSDTARYERAFREQAEVIARTEARARQAGCFGGFFLFQRPPDQVCNTLVPGLRDMQANLAHLDQLRRQGGGGNSRRIRELQGMLAARGCAIPGGSFFNALRGLDRLFEPEPYRSRRGTVRTLCVRTCDGYYFPISFSTTQDRLPEDQHTCEAMCPATEAKLFYHSNPGGGPEDMVALDGQFYSSLPTAFQYRTSLEPSCTCRPAGEYAEAAPMSRIPDAEPDTVPSVPLPRPAPGEDSETLANRLGNFTPYAIPSEDGASRPLAASPDGRSVRVVGPAYWDTSRDEEVMLTPVPN
jgi:hypothetical protein